jgi:hypothetical protein
MATKELKPCPFCGGKPSVMSCDGSGTFYSFLSDSGKTNFMYGRKMSHFLIKCQKCNVRTKAYATTKGLFNAWQRRLSNGKLCKLCAY